MGPTAAPEAQRGVDLRRTHELLPEQRRIAVLPDIGVLENLFQLVAAIVDGFRLRTPEVLAVHHIGLGVDRQVGWVPPAVRDVTGQRAGHVGLFATPE